jgi:hypothetical protein
MNSSYNLKEKVQQRRNTFTNVKLFNLLNTTTSQLSLIQLV